ncbi:MAG: SUMF1/EgtB/PvdO family nonheme iron enzyme [Chloroflexota bacterium]
MQLFISYARVDRPYCMQIVELLEPTHKVWYDHRLRVGQNWWQEIVRQIMTCQGFVYLISPESLASKYCNNELAVARGANKPIFPVIIHPEAKLPADLGHVHAQDLTKGLTPTAVRDLLSAIHSREIHELRQASRIDKPEKPLNGNMQKVVDSVTRTIKPEPVMDPVVLVAEVTAAMDADDYDKASRLLRESRDSGLTSPYFNISQLLHEVEGKLQKQTFERHAEREYRQIVPLVKSKSTQHIGCDAFVKFREKFPNYDPEGLRNLCSIAIMPRLEWCDIPEGEVMLEHEGRQVIYHVESFRLSKDPITNAQFQAFVDAPDGYADPIWWDFSPQAKAWRTANSSPARSKFHWGDNPRDSVCWYEAMAYCRWVSHRTGLEITLPTEQQWQRAAQGDDQRGYPWGTRFDKARCNSRESGRLETCSVKMYSNGQSPFDVRGMAGNVWEWCLNTESKKTRQPQPSSPDEHLPRAVRGGSYMSVSQRVKSTFHYYLNPLYRYATIGFRVATRAE